MTECTPESRRYYSVYSVAGNHPSFLVNFIHSARSSVSVGNEKIKHSRNWNCFYTISLSSIALCQLFMAFLGNVGLVLLIKSLCVLNVAFRVHQNCVYMKIFAAPVLSQLCWKGPKGLLSAHKLHRYSAENEVLHIESRRQFSWNMWGMAQNISPRLTQDIEKADIPDGCGNCQIIQNRTQKNKIGLGKMEALKWP